MPNIIEAQNLKKTYGSTIAVSDVSIAVEKGEIFAIAGPNGAGKTTTLSMLTGLRQPDSGTISVLGLNPQKDERALRQRIGIQLQEAALPERIKVWEALDMYASFYAKAVPWEPLLDEWGLTEKRNTHSGNLSGGQKQRLFIALALLNDPELVFLDELTTGLDPQARRATWEAVNAIRERGKTVVLVTHFMDEAEALADRIAIIDKGQVIAKDTPQALIKSLKAETQVRFTHENGFQPTSLHDVEGVTNVSTTGRQVLVQGNGALLARVAAALAQQNITPSDLHVEQANLEDVFLALTGRQIRA